MKNASPMRHLSMLGAWALAFGCAVGSDAFVMPWTMFLPKAGPLGTILGIFLGGLVMSVVAWNYHYMINHRPGPGGAYEYASEAFGHDHGYLCGIFLGFAYVAIVWLDVTALVALAHYMLGDVFSFGFCYTIEGREIYLGDILLAMVAIVVTSAICCRCRLSGIVQTVLAIVFAGGIIACFLASVLHHDGGFKAMGPAFAPKCGNGFIQIMNVFAIAPWLFVGFEAISNSSAEFRFPVKRSFWIMLAALFSAVVAYVFLTTIPVLASGNVAGGWTGAISGIVGDPDYHAFRVAGGFFGKAGGIIISATLIGAIFTNLVGNTVAVSRLTAAMAEDGAFPSLMRRRSADGAPRNAVLGVAVLTALVVPLGQAVIGVVVDISIVGAAIAYAYTSAAAFKLSRIAGDRRTMTMGLLGLLLSVVIIVLFIIPFVLFDIAMIATESYLVLMIWCLAALSVFLTVFHRDTLRRFGRSSVVWISLFIIILILSVMWILQTTHETTENAFNAIISHHAENCMSVEQGRDMAVEHGKDKHVHGATDWRVILRQNLSVVNRSIIRNNLVQGGLNLLALILMFCLYKILRRRERDIEREKAKAKSYFFSTVSHDIRTPLNAIIGFSEMLKVGFKTEAEREKAIDSILMSGRTLLGLINDVLDLSKLESGKMDIVPEPTDCARQLHAVMDSFRVSAGNSGIELRCRVDAMPYLQIDPQRLRQIVFNLVGNAVKFTEKGHVELRASFTQDDEADMGEFRLEVEDTGCGISEEDRENIGSAYVQVGDKKARNGGTGLGLAICRQLVAAMGGIMEVDSVLGKGSTFRLVIPGVRIAPEIDETKNVPSDLGGAPRQLPHRILLVDDSKMNLMVLKALLSNLGDFEISMVKDGQEALKVLEDQTGAPVDLVFTDMWMPNLDGVGLARAIRANPSLSSVRIVVVTADVECQDKFVEMGFDGILLKPVTINNLRKALVGEM